MNCGRLKDNSVRRGHKLQPAISDALERLDALRLPEADLRIDATFSEDCGHRYVWRLRWSDEEPRNPLLVVGLIASTADERQDDPTVRKCIEIAARNRHTELVMLNMFSRWPTPDHRDAAINPLLVDVVDPANDQCTREWTMRVRESGGTIVAAWGNDGWSRHTEVLSHTGADPHLDPSGGRYGLGSTSLVASGAPNNASMRLTLSRFSVMKVDGTTRTPSWPSSSNRLDSLAPRRT